MFGLEYGFVPYVIGCLLVAVMLPIVIFKVFECPRGLGIPIMMIAVSLILYSWASVAILLFVSIIRRYTDNQQR